MHKNSEGLSRLIFVGGSPRSGTTLIQQLLNYHPAVYGGPEFDFVPEIAKLFRRMRQSIRSGRIDNLLNEASLAHSYRSLIVSLLIPKADAEGVRFLSEKTPSNVLAFDVLEELLPESRKIFVIRDPRDVVNSMLEVGDRQTRRVGYSVGFGCDIVSAVNYMNQCLLAGIALAERNEVNCMIVYYEDVVANPLEATNRMYKFIGVECLERIDLETARFEAARDKASWIDYVASGRFGGDIVKNRVGASLAHLTRSDLAYIAAKTVKHQLITQKYKLDLNASAIGPAWCLTKTAGARLRRRLRRLPGFVIRKLFR
jgi:hypothetical protein